MKYDYGHWAGGESAEAGELSDPAAHVPGGELHIERVWPGPHKGGVHGMTVHMHHSPDATHTAADMSKAADDYLKLLG